MTHASNPSLGNMFKIALMVLGSLLLIGLVVTIVGIFPTPMLGVLALAAIGIALLPLFFRERR